MTIVKREIVGAVRDRQGVKGELRRRLGAVINRRRPGRLSAVSPIGTQSTRTSAISPPGISDLNRRSDFASQPVAGQGSIIRACSTRNSVVYRCSRPSPSRIVAVTRRLPGANPDAFERQILGQACTAIDISSPSRWTRTLAGST